MKYTPPVGQETEGESAHYINGNPELGILGSPVPAEAVEHPQREIVEVIKQAGLEPSGDDLTQLFQAIGEIISAKAPIATTKKPGLVRIGDGLAITPEGLLSVLIASTSRAGLVKPRYGLKIGADGSLDVDFGDMPTDKFEELLKSIRVPIWLTKPLTVYVAPTGSDTLDEGRGLTPDKPFATIKAAVNHISTTYNLYSYNVTISVAPGDYGRNTINLPSYSTTTGKIIISGQSSIPDETICGRILLAFASNYEIHNIMIYPGDVTSGTIGAIQASSGTLYLYNVKLRIRDVTVGNGTLWGVNVSGAAFVNIMATQSEDVPSGVIFDCGGDMASGLILANAAKVEFSADLTVLGDASFRTATIRAQQGGAISRTLSSFINPGRAPVVTASGTITGKRYVAALNGIIAVSGGGGNFWPGSIDGETTSGGQYA